MQEELFGTHMAGEIFFQNLQSLLGRSDSPDLADLLEVHYLCLLLGYRGRYSVGSTGELQAAMQATADKIRQDRASLKALSPGLATAFGEIAQLPRMSGPEDSMHPGDRLFLSGPAHVHRI